MSSTMELRTRAVGPWPMNTYALVCPTTRESILIDPGADPETLHDMLTDTKPIAIVLTHTHGDHVGALDVMRKQLQVPLIAGDYPHFQGKQLNEDQMLRDGDMLQVGEHKIQAYHTSGHCDDMLCLVIQNDHRVVVGDTIFEGGPGKTWSPENFETTLETLRNIILTWSDETMCYPGHGPHFRLGDKRAAIETFVNKDHGAFFGDATWDM